MRREISIVDFVTDPEILGLSLSQPQEVLLRAGYGLPLTKSQTDIFRVCTGRDQYPRHSFAELTVIAGARAYLGMKQPQCRRDPHAAFPIGPF